MRREPLATYRSWPMTQTNGPGDGREEVARACWEHGGRGKWTYRKQLYHRQYSTARQVRQRGRR